MTGWKPILLLLFADEVFHQSVAGEFFQTAGLTGNFVVAVVAIGIDSRATNGKWHVAVGVSFGADISRVIGRYQNSVVRSHRFQFLVDLSHDMRIDLFECLDLFS